MLCIGRKRQIKDYYFIQYFHRSFWMTLFLVMSQCTDAGVMDHLKSIKDKGSGHSMKNIDFIYVINLDHRPEKFEMCVEQLSKYGIAPYRFSAIYGKDLSIDVLNNVGVVCEPSMPKGLKASYYEVDQNGKINVKHDKFLENGRTYFSHHMGTGPIAIVLSHLSVLKDAYDSGYETVWIMEDDIQIIQDPRSLSVMIDKLDAITKKKGWDILFTDQDTKNKKNEYVPCFGFAPRPDFHPKKPERFSKRHIVGKYFKKIGARYGAYSFIIRKSGMKQILDFYANHNIFLPYDLEYFLPDNIKIYTVIDDIVSTIPNALSDNK